MNGIWLGSPVAGVLGLVAFASAASANICDSAARNASSVTGVPLDVMQTITRLETGRGKTADPWPWTVNHAGNGSWFQSEDEARSFVFSKIKQGESNLDIGCFQINYRWHSSGFRSLDEMFNPETNALYAARFLTQLHQEFGSWTLAAGAYHSRTPQYAERYKAKFSDLRVRMTEADPESIPILPDSNLTLWGRSGLAQRGSLFLSQASGSRPFIVLQEAN